MKKEIVNELLSNLKNMVDILQSVSDTEEEVKTPVKKKRGRPKKKKVESKNEKTFIRESESRKPQFTHNKFEDMDDIVIDKPDGYDKIDDSVKRTRKTRKAYQPAILTCDDCGKQVKVNPMFKKDRFVCDRCVGRRFGR